MQYFSPTLKMRALCILRGGMLQKRKLSRIGNSSFDIQSAIFLNNDPKPAANSVVSCVCFDYEQSKSVPVYDEIKADFQLDK